ncbi:MAG: hypothetical protein HS111_31390 [Kofleriaceae bacterium]|nr:hypothetical protein [Kofleriaceae bacterium]
MSAFSFFDDSFAVGRRRVHELCDALARLPGPVHWTCTAHPAHLDRDVLAAMQRGGCGGVDIGMESADPGVLLRIGRGSRSSACSTCSAGARTSASTPSSTSCSAGPTGPTTSSTPPPPSSSAPPLAGGFNARGVVVPYPGTQLYREHHARFGFTGWWLREPPLVYPFPTRWDEAGSCAPTATTRPRPQLLPAPAAPGRAHPRRPRPQGQRHDGDHPAPPRRRVGPAVGVPAAGAR